MAACSEAPTAPVAASKAPTNRAAFDFTCRSGYLVAFDEDGNPYCVQESTTQRQSGARP